MLGLSPIVIAVRLITLVIAFTVHEFAHAFTADRLGDDTPRLAGRLTLNPLAHLDVFGSLLLVVAGLGWAKPVPVNPYALQRRSPAGMMIVAAAGPLSNLGLAAVAAVPLRLAPVPIEFLQLFLLDFIFLNLILTFFNLIPIFPLDGEKVFSHFLPPSGQAWMAQLRPYGPILLLFVILVSSRSGLDVLGLLVRQPALTVMRLLGV